MLRFHKASYAEIQFGYAGALLVEAHRESRICVNRINGGAKMAREKTTVLSSSRKTEFAELVIKSMELPRLVAGEGYSVDYTRKNPRVDINGNGEIRIHLSRQIEQQGW